MGQYATYPKYKQSNGDWIGDVPLSWDVRRFKFLLTEPLQYGANEPAELSDTDLPRYIRITDVKEDGSLREETFRSLPEEIAQPYLLHDGDILLARSGATVGKTFIYKKSWGRAAFAGYLIRARTARNLLSADFAYYFLQSTAYWHWLNSVSIQATIQNVSAEKYANLQIPLPTKPEQQFIARFLDFKTVQIDVLIAKKQTLLEKLAEKRTALISHAVTKGLDPSVPMKDSGVEWLGEIPAHWRVISVRWLIRIGSGDFISNQETEFDYSEFAQIPVIGGNGVMAYTNKANTSANCIVIGRVGAHCGNVHFIREESWVTDNALRLTIIFSEVLEEFLICALKTIGLNDYANKNAQPLITGEMVKSKKIALPPLKEQTEIFNSIRKIEEYVEKQVLKTRMAIDKLQEYRSALITNAVTGKIDVRKWQVPKEVA